MPAPGGFDNRLNRGIFWLPAEFALCFGGVGIKRGRIAGVARDLPPREARETLAQPAHVFAALAERLGKRAPPYAGIFHALVALAGVKPDAEALAEIDLNTPEDDPARIDEEWEEAPVSFNSQAAHEMGGATGVVAKIRASNRAVNREAGT